MIFENRNKGKVVIHLKLENESLSSVIQRRGIAMDDKMAISAVMATYISMCRSDGRDPVELLRKNVDRLDQIMDDTQRSIDE